MLVKDRYLTEKLKSIIGNEVDYAYSTRYPDDNGELLDSATYSNDTIEPIDSRPVFVKMTSGKMFIIWSSEWGGITKVNNENHIPSSG